MTVRIVRSCPADASASGYGLVTLGVKTFLLNREVSSAMPGAGRDASEDHPTVEHHAHD